MYHSPVSGKYYTFTTDFNTNVVFQFELNGSTGSVTGTWCAHSTTATQLRGWSPTITCSASTSPKRTSGSGAMVPSPAMAPTRVLMDSIVASGGHLVNNVKNTAIYYKSDGGGYLVASSQGSGGSFQIYNRVDNAFVGEFKVTNGINGVDGVNGQDGIDLTNFNLGPGVSSGSLRHPGPRQHQRRQRQQRQPELQVRPLAVDRQRLQPRRCPWTPVSIRAQSAASGGSPTPSTNRADSDRYA